MKNETLERPAAAMRQPTRPPSADVLIICADPRFARMLEIEVDRLTLRPAVAASRPRSNGSPNEPITDAPLLLMDLDENPPPIPLPDGFTLIGWSRDPDALTDDLPAGGVILRRPFALAALRQALLSALPERVLRPAVPAPAVPAPAEPPAAATAPCRPPRLMPAAHPGAVCLDGQEIPLTPSEWAVWSYLTACPGKVVPRETLRALLAGLPGVRAGGDGNAVDVCICRLRAKLEKPLGVRLITAVRGQGYRFDGLPDTDK